MFFHLYGLIVGVGVVAGWSVAEKIDSRVNHALPWMLGFAIFGARLYHVIDLWSYYSQHLVQIPAIWNGGIGIFGGIIGGAVGLFVYKKKSKIADIWKIIGAIVTGLPLGQAIGRWGNLANNELWGKHHEPLFLYESILDLFLFSILWQLQRKKMPPQGIVGSYLVGYGAIRLLLEPLKPNPWWFGYVVASAMVVLGVVLWYKSRTTIIKHIVGGTP